MSQVKKDLLSVQKGKLVAKVYPDVKSNSCAPQCPWGFVEPSNGSRIRCCYSGCSVSLTRHAICERLNAPGTVFHFLSPIQQS